MRITALLLALCAVLAAATPKQASASILLFDFEDGTAQGWALANEAVLDDRNPLGGRYSIAGIDKSRLSLTIDLTGIQYMVVDARFDGLPSDIPLEPPPPSPEEAQRQFIFAVATRRSPSGTVLEARTIGLGAILDDPALHEPHRRRYELSSLSGVWELTIRWNDLVCIPEEPLRCFAETFPGVVDNITLVPEVEPALLALLAVASVRLGICRKRSGAVTTAMSREE